MFSAGGSTGLPFAPDARQCSGLLLASEIYPVRLLLPTLVSANEKALFESPWYLSVPLKIDPVLPSDEHDIIEQLISELNSKYNTNLAGMCTVDRELEEVIDSSTDDALSNKRFVLVGASHMTRLVCAFEDLGATVFDLSILGWRISTSAVDEMNSNLSAVLAEEYSGETYIVYQLFDNSSYISCDSSGERSLPVKMADNKYHVPGRLVMVKREEFRKLFTSIPRILRAGLQHIKMLLTPLARYLQQSCCTDPSHITNRKE
jgi:hypothetical protein